jgi:hypothetical protein
LTHIAKQVFIGVEMLDSTPRYMEVSVVVQRLLLPAGVLGNSKLNSG